MIENLKVGFWPKTQDGIRTSKNCLGENEVWYYKINNWGHEWPRENSGTGTTASKAIWEFFSKF